MDYKVLFPTKHEDIPDKGAYHIIVPHKPNVGWILTAPRAVKENRSFSPNMSAGCEAWIVDGLPHKEFGPSCIWVDRNGQLSTSVWTCHGEIHNINGPALARWRNGEPLSLEYFILGKRCIDKHDWELKREEAIKRLENIRLSTNII